MLGFSLNYTFSLCTLESWSDMPSMISGFFNSILSQFLGFVMIFEIERAAALPFNQLIRKRILTG